ncbi:MAG: DegV family protein [Blautia sp.]|nr:DegV family protein [Blautia sp.]
MESEVTLMAIRIVADSASDIPQEQAREWNITVLPLTIRFGEEEFLDGVTLSHDEFFYRLENNKEFPKTSQITPFTYGKVFKEAVEVGDEVLCFTLSSGVSGSYASACMAAEEAGGKVFVIDTRQFCISEYILVQRAVQLRDAGLSFEELLEKIKEELPQVHVLAAFDTLEYLRRGGRLSAVTAFAGGMLSIKPVLTIEEGVVHILGKARGIKKACDSLLEEAKKIGVIDGSRPICFGYTGNSQESIMAFMERFKDAAKLTMNTPLVRVGATIGAYAGPGAVAVAFFAR